MTAGPPVGRTEPEVTFAGDLDAFRQHLAARGGDGKAPTSDGSSRSHEAVKGADLNRRRQVDRRVDGARGPPEMSPADAVEGREPDGIAVDGEGPHEGGVVEQGSADLDHAVSIAGEEQRRAGVAAGDHEHHRSGAISSVCDGDAREQRSGRVQRLECPAAGDAEHHVVGGRVVDANVGGDANE